MGRKDRLARAEARAARDNLNYLHQAIWMNMARENDVMNYRITWAIVFSAGIFTATSVLAGILIAIGTPLAVRAAVLALMAVLSATGIFFSQRTQNGVLAAHEQHDYLKQQYEEREAEFEAIRLPRPYGEQTAHDRGNRAAIVFPDLLIRIWISAVVIELGLAAVFATLAYQQWQPEKAVPPPPVEQAAPATEQTRPDDAEPTDAIIGFFPVLPPPISLPRPSPVLPSPSS